MDPLIFQNPFRPGAGHMPPYLAGREEEKNEFIKLIHQSTILENMVLTGLRGIGKTVLLDTFKPLAVSNHWLWVGTDLSESASISEENLAIRLLTDLSVITSNITVTQEKYHNIGFLQKEETKDIKLGFDLLFKIYVNTPGLILDKIKTVLEFVWELLKESEISGLIFAYDEAQNLSDHAKKEQYPLGVLLDLFQSLQKKDIPFMLVLTGLPTLFPRLVDSRTFAERMFRVIFLEKLNPNDSKKAILKPIESSNCPVQFTDESVELIIENSGGYPYFIQFICREAYDVFLPKIEIEINPSVPLQEITRKLDSDFFAGRWSRATDRQRELLLVISKLDNADDEFSVQDIVELSKTTMERSFSSSHTNQMLSSLCTFGLIYKNRFGKYSFAVPLLNQFIIRQNEI